MDQPVGCRRRWEHARRVGRWGLTGLLVIGGLILAGHAGVVAAEPPSKGGTIVWAVHEGMPTFDIHDETTYIAAQPIGPLYNGLLTCDVYDHEKIVGDLAERWEITPDGKHITFALRTGVKFHDGSDFTCADAKYSLEKLADPNRAHRTFVAIIEKVFDGTTCTDDFTLVLHLKEPPAAIFTMLAGAHAVMMKAGIAERVDRKDPKFLMGTGPFKVQILHTGRKFSGGAQPALLEVWFSLRRCVRSGGHARSDENLCLLPGPATDHDGDRPPPRTARGRHPAQGFS
jgi:ABC-type transport system substrate-binding protein